MALKIKTKIGTQKGILDEVYVRLENIVLTKRSASAKVLIYTDQDQSNEYSETHIGASESFLNNDEIGTHFVVPLKETKEVMKTFHLTDDKGKKLFSNGKAVTEERPVPETKLINQEVFESPVHKFMYKMFKAELESKFGKVIEDC